MPRKKLKSRLAFHRLRPEAGARPIRLYGLRHTAASAMIARGVQVPDASCILGHSSPVVTMRVYRRWPASHRRRGTELMGSVFASTLRAEEAEAAP